MFSPVVPRPDHPATPAADDLRTEAIRFAWYLVRAEPSEALIERYVQANAALFLDPPTERDTAVLRFAHAYPWSLPLLDAGTAVGTGAPRLRRKLLVMMAILEATPELVDRTAPVESGTGPVELAFRIAKAGAVAAFELAAGAALAIVVGRRRDGR